MDGYRSSRRTPVVVFVATVAFACEIGWCAAQRDGSTIPMPGEISGKVIHVADGDTLTVLDGNRFQRVIRLTDIDAPEAAHGSRRPGQPYAARATEAMKRLAMGEQARAVCYDVDVRPREDGTVLERYVCRVFAGGKDVNMAMIDAGMAMANRQSKRYVRDQATYAHEDAARRDHRGLWAQPQPVSPWEWRRTCWKRQQCNGAGD